MLHPMMQEISDEYRALRASGSGREEAVSRLRAEYHNELQYMDDAPYVHLGIALALCRRGELTPDTAEPAKKAVEELRRIRPEKSAQLKRIEKTLDAPESSGAEKPAKKRKRYDPQWSVGDTFIRRLESPIAAEEGLAGWYVVIRKVGKFVDHLDKLVQLVVLSVCPPDAIPKTGDDVKKLGNLKMMDAITPEGLKANYLAHIQIGCSRTEKAFALEKIGCFPDVPLPEDQQKDPDVRIAMPLATGNDRWGNTLLDRVVAMAYHRAVSPPKSETPPVEKKSVPKENEYRPPWEVGDTFIHAFEDPIAEKCGIAGWYMVIRKIGEYRNDKGELMQSVTTSVCPPDAIPKTAADLKELGVIPMHPIRSTRDYRAQMRIVSKRGENAFGLTKIGCFPDVGLPDDQMYTLQNCYLMPLATARTPQGDRQFEMRVASSFRVFGLTKIL